MQYRLILLFLFLSFYNSNAQKIIKIHNTNDIKFERIGLKQGLSLSSVYCIFQDSKGLIWCGTEDGLNQYDGYKFKIFRYDPQNPNSLSHNWVENIFEDKSQNLWIITQRGLTKYNPKYEKFTRYYNEKNNAGSITRDTVSVWLEDTQKRLWFGTEGGLNLYLPETDNFRRFIHYKESKTSICANHITALCEDKEGKIWIGTKKGLCFFNKKKRFERIDIPIKKINSIFCDSKNNLWIGTNLGLCIYNQKTKKIEFFKHNEKDKNSLSNNIIQSIFEDSFGFFWIGTKRGFDRFNPKTKTFENLIFDSKDGYSLSGNLIRPIWQDKKEKIWLGTFGEGLFCYQHFTNNLLCYKKNPINLNSISENSIRAIFEDKTGVLWFGTFGAGINKFDPNQNKFPILKRDPHSKNTLSSNFVWSICEDKKGQIWIGTNSDGLSCYNPKSGKYIHYKYKEKDINSLSGNSIRSVFEDSKGNLWIGTNGDGLNFFNPFNKRFIHYCHDKENKSSISDNSVRTFMEDSKGNIWIGTQNGLNKFNPKTKKFTQYLHNPNDSNSISHNFIYSTIFEDSKGKIWIGTHGGGLNCYNPKNDKFTLYAHDYKNSKSLSNNVVFCIYEHSDNNLYIATQYGLNIFDPKTKEFSLITNKDGLPNNVVYGILPDDKEDLWLSTNKGICRYNTKEQKFRNYDVADGLQSNEFNGGAFHKGKSGRLYFGGVQGVNLFYPDSIKDNPYSPTIIIRNFQIANKDIPIFGENIGIDDKISAKKQKNEEYVFPFSVSFAHKIELGYNAKIFSIEFAALHYSEPNKNNYMYMMENFETEWSPVGKRRFVTYTNMLPGEYRFKIKACNSDGVWIEKPYILKIKILPPFWMTWEFILGCLFFLMGLVYFVYRLRVNQIKEQNKELERQVKERTAKITKQNERLALQKKEILTQTKKIQKAHDKIVIAHEIINNKNRHITDSIHYASRIQAAVFPSKERINRLLPEHFILFRPRDIVSGDFYWMKKIGKQIIVTAADCTGHGVPGAFMSMLGISLLNRIIQRKDTCLASEVLNELRCEVKYALGQTGKRNEAKDGMDMCLCMLNPETKMLQYAGAYNPLYIIRKTEKHPKENFWTKIEEKKDLWIAQIKGDKMPIGIYIREKESFTNHKIQLLSNDILYMFSDGYPDQWGGERGRKFLNGNFRNLLISISKFELSEQKEILEKRLESWRSIPGKNGEPYEQVDDILVVGIKV